MAGLKKYLRENWGAPFVVCFMILILISVSIEVAPLPILNRYIPIGSITYNGIYYENMSIFLPDLLAEIGAVLAYFVLVVGVILQVVSFFRYRKSRIE